MKKILSVLVIAIVTITYSQESYAGSANAGEAQELKTMLTEHINTFRTMYESMSEVSLEYTDELSVTPAGNYYKVLFPKIDLGISNPNNPADSFNIHLDSIAVNASKQGDDAWSMSIAVPMPIKATNGSDETLFNINIGSQKAHMLFMPSLKTSPKYLLSYKDITIDDIADANLQVNLGEITTSLKLEKQAPNSWTGPGKFIVKDVKVLSDDNDVAIGSIEMNATYTDFDLETMSMLYSDIMNTDLIPESLSEQKTTEFLNKVLVSMMSSIGGMTSDMSINGLKASYSDPETGKSDNFSLGRASFGFGAEQLKTNKANFELKYGMKDLQISEIPAEMSGFVPTSGDFHVQIKNTPIQSLFSLGQNALNGQVNPVKAQGDVINMLVNAGTKILIKKQDIETPEMGLTTSGEVSTDTNATWKAIADITMKIRNLDGVIAKFSADSAKIPSGMKQILGALTMAQAMGQQETLANGEPARSYHLQLTPKGEMLLNGTDMSAMLGIGVRQGSQQLK